MRSAFGPADDSGRSLPPMQRIRVRLFALRSDACGFLFRIRNSDNNAFPRTNWVCGCGWLRLDAWRFSADCIGRANGEFRCAEYCGVAERDAFSGYSKQHEVRVGLFSNRLACRHRDVLHARSQWLNRVVAKANGLSCGNASVANGWKVLECFGVATDARLLDGGAALDWNRHGVAAVSLDTGASWRTRIDRDGRGAGNSARFLADLASRCRSKCRDWA